MLKLYEKIGLSGNGLPDFVFIGVGISEHENSLFWMGGKLMKGGIYHGNSKYPAS